MAAARSAVMLGGKLSKLFAYYTCCFQMFYKHSWTQIRHLWWQETVWISACKWQHEQPFSFMCSLSKLKCSAVWIYKQHRPFRQWAQLWLSMGWTWLIHKLEWVSRQTTLHPWLEKRPEGTSLHVKRRKAEQIYSGESRVHNINSETECRHITWNQSYGKTDVAGGQAAIHKSLTATPISSW